MDIYLPKVKASMNDFKSFKQKMEDKLKDQEVKKGGTMDPTAIR